MLVSDTSTTELVVLGAAGDQRAWDQLVDRFTRLVWHVILGFRLSEQAGEDVHQTTWLRLAESSTPSASPSASAVGWPPRPATNASGCCGPSNGDRHRHRRGTDRGTLDPLDKHLLDTERDVAVLDAFLQLPENCQQLLRLLVTDPPFSYEEIAAVLEMPVGSIGPTRARCLESSAVIPT